MKGDPGIVLALNGLLADELAAVNQYTAHRLFLRAWGYAVLSARVKDRAEDEQRHVKKIADRILELGGVPDFANVGKVFVEPDSVPAQIAADDEAETRAIESTNAAVKVAFDAGDQTTAHILTHIVKEECDHLAELEGWQKQIEQMGVEGFLSSYVEV